MKVIVTDKVDREQWDDFVERHPLGSIYHHSAWQDVIKKTYGYKPLYHLLLDDNGNLQAAISSVLVKSWLTGKRIVSFPFSDTCDPLIRKDDELEALLDALEQSKFELNAHLVELRFAQAYPFSKYQTSNQEYYNHKLSLDRDPKTILSSFHKSSVQRAIKKAKDQGLEVVDGMSEEDLKAFYHLHLLTRKKQGMPIQPYRFFKHLFSELAPRGMLTLSLALHKHRPVAGIVMLWHQNTAYYKFGASDESFLHLRGNQLLMWEAIQRAQENGFRNFDFGRTSLANKGLAQYKSRWGTKSVTLHYLRLPEVAKAGALNESSKKHLTLKKMIARMPAIVIRMTGEIFYKHFA
jgi:lipid II:glycine glycyltransferase (peptidoglycan interpeptide bridge formation enzyme)